MTLREVGCRACAEITSGDCRQHGPLVIPLVIDQTKAKPKPLPICLHGYIICCYCQRPRGHEWTP